MKTGQLPLGFNSKEEWENFATRDELKFKTDPELPKAVLNVWNMVAKSCTEDAELLFIALSWNGCFIGQFQQSGDNHCFVIYENDEGAWSMRHNTTTSIEGYIDGIRECSLIYAPNKDITIKPGGLNDDESETLWEHRQDIKRWYENRVEGLPGHQYIARCQGFVDIWLEDYGSAEARARFQSHLISNQEEDYRDTSDTLKAKEDFRDAEREISQKLGVRLGTEQHKQLLKAVAECAVGCLIGINADIAERNEEPMIREYFKTMEDFWDNFYDLAFKGKNNFQDEIQEVTSLDDVTAAQLLIQAISDERSDAYASPFGYKLRKDLDYLAALSAAMYHAGVTIEAQPLYTGLHIYATRYALQGLKHFSQSISAHEAANAGEWEQAWTQDHGLEFAAAVVKEFSEQRYKQMEEKIQLEGEDAIHEIKELTEEAIGMAMGATAEFIKSIVENTNYQPGDVQAALSAAIEEYCPIDNSDGYQVSANPRVLIDEWEEVLRHSGCQERLDMQSLGLPPDDKNTSQESCQEVILNQSDVSQSSQRIFYVNVGEGQSRNWDDCRNYGFLAAGGGRKWSKQLEKIQPGDQVIAYLKGYGYVGIGIVTASSRPSSKFLVNGTHIKELPLVNDTIRSTKRFSTENGEYLIGVKWLAAVPRENAAWKPNSGLYTTALVCASLQNQPETVDFVFRSFNLTRETIPSTDVALR